VRSMLKAARSRCGFVRQCPRRPALRAHARGWPRPSPTCWPGPRGVYYTKCLRNMFSQKMPRRYQVIGLLAYWLIGLLDYRF
jgi:hypothetical protein